MKILSALSLIHGGMVQVWAMNEINTVLAHTSTQSMLEGLLACIERTFGDPDGWYIPVRVQAQLCLIRPRCHDLFPKLSPQSLELSLLLCIHSISTLPGPASHP